MLVATGPLTNIAAALLRDPELPLKLKRFVLMGGAFREAGNVTPTAEFNIWHDPEAARIVFRAFGAEGAAPLVAVGLDVTRKTMLTPGGPRGAGAAPCGRAARRAAAALSSRTARAIISI